MEKKRFNRDYFVRCEDCRAGVRVNILLSYDVLVSMLGSKASKVFAYVQNPPIHAERSNGSIVVKPFHGLKLTFIYK